MSAEQMPLEQGVLNKTIEQKMYSPSAYWTNQQLKNCRLNTEQNQLSKFSIEQHPIEHLHYYSSNLNIAQESIEQDMNWTRLLKSKT